MSTKKADKATSKKSSSEKHEEAAAAATTGRAHTIAKARPTPVTGAPKDKPVAVSVSSEGSDETPKTPTKPAKRPTTSVAPAQPDDSQEVCVFAFRLLRCERDEIHAVTGSARASKFIRTLALAAVRRDSKLVEDIVDEVHAPRG